MSKRFLDVLKKVRGGLLYELYSGLRRWGVGMVSRKRLAAVVDCGPFVLRDSWMG
jgi:hypothetical protein